MDTTISVLVGGFSEWQRKWKLLSRARGLRKGKENGSYCLGRSVYGIVEDSVEHEVATGLCFHVRVTRGLLAASREEGMFKTWKLLWA